MSGREWAPGDVAAVTWGPVGLEPETDVRLRAYSGEARKEVWWGPRGYLTDASSITVRPLVVIDPEDRENVKRLLRLFGEQYTSWTPDVDGPNVDLLQAALREFASPTPPRINEPEVWGVVEASCVHSGRRLQWVRHPDGNWWPFAAYGEDDLRPMPDDWDSLIEPELVREGVQ